MAEVDLTGQLATAMITLYRGDAKRIQHFMKVYAYARMIALEEQVNRKLLQTIEAAALVHDIGIHAAEKKYGSSVGKFQEQEGPPIARAMLLAVGYAPNVTDRICYLVGHHHTYTDIDGIDYQILVEADFLVNVEEEHMDQKKIRSVYEKIFQTETGKQYLTELCKLDA